MRPEFNADTCYIQTGDGVYLRNNRSCLALKGKSLYPLLEHLVPHLNGSTALEEITDGLDVQRKGMVTNLIEKLATHHFLRDASQYQSSQLSTTELECYASNMTFTESFHEPGDTQLERFQQQRFLIIGSRTDMSALVQAGSGCGMRRIDVVIASDADASAFVDACDTFPTCDAEQIVQTIDSPCWDDETSVIQVIRSYDTVIHIAQESAIPRALTINKVCREQQKTCLQALIVNNHAWIGPLVSDAGGCWECAWRRLQANMINHHSHREPASSQRQPLSVAATTILMNRLLFEVLKHITQTGFTKIVDQMVDIDLITYQSDYHIFQRHPRCHSCQHPVFPTAQQFLARMQQLRRQEPLIPETFCTSIVPYFDERTGLFATCNDGGFTQAPLAVYQVNFSDPQADGDSDAHYRERYSVIAVSTEMKEARKRVFQRAAECYAACFVDQRRLLPSEAGGQTAQPDLSTAQWIESGLQQTSDGTRTWALDLHTGQACLVPVAQVFCSSDEQWPHKNMRGIASGMEWEEAISQALLGWCTYLTVEQLEHTSHTYAPVDLSRVPMTSEGAYAYQLLQASAERITAYDVTGILQVPTLAICMNERVVAYSTHWNVAQALSRGFERALQQYQAERCRQPEYAIVPVVDLPAALRGDQECVPQFMPPESWAQGQKWLLQRLHENGFRAYVTPLDHDSALAQVMPYIVRVLLRRAEVKDGQ